ncbi:MAG: signal peptide peptidase SppA [Proteobacteria bacterium]|nr:signal peptide peptidase SppA [Pseudomonadota bacterium]MBU1545777.1 signal peptide peptidase SppA [Pseudomonadota bacterium]MBU2619718.1 signal peptide peptidase SppA [Pseudomonadota bacterium]
MLFFWGGITFFVTSLTGPSKSELFLKEGVGVIDVKGVILESEEILANLVAFREEPKIKGIVLRIDSPGGAVGASQEIYDEVRRTSKVKPVVASMGSVAASGGLYVSLGAGKIVANPGTLTGSMGVILKFANLEGLFDKIGYKNEVVKSGRLKDIGSPSRPMTEEERQMLQGMIDNVQEQFVLAVSESRSLPAAEVRKIADGRIFSGLQAKEYGLVDQLGNFSDAVMLAAELSGITSDRMPELIYPREDDFSFLRLMTGKNSESLLQQTGLSGPVLAYEWTGTLR